MVSGRGDSKPRSMNITCSIPLSLNVSDFVGWASLLQSSPTIQHPVPFRLLSLPTGLRHTEKHGGLLARGPTCGFARARTGRQVARGSNTSRSERLGHCELCSESREYMNIVGITQLDL